MDAGPDQGRLHARLHWAPDGRSVSWTLVKGQMQKAQNGSLRARRQRRAARPSPTRSPVDLNIPMIGMLRRKAEKVIIDTALKGLKRRVEALPEHAPDPRSAVTLVACGSCCSPARAGSARRPSPRPPPPSSPRSGRKTLVVSTDPAHSLGDALEAGCAGEPTEVDGLAACSPPTSTPARCSTARGASCASTCARCWPAPASTSWSPRS